LEDGLGDTVRVSLTEEPEVEAPVAKIMVDRYMHRVNHRPIKPVTENPIDPFAYSRRLSREVSNIGGHHHVPRVIADLSRVGITEYKDLRSIGHFYLPEPDKWRMNDQGADYVYTGMKPIPFMLPNGLKEIRDFKIWTTASDDINKLPLFTKAEFLETEKKHVEINFVRFSADDLSDDFLSALENEKTAVAVFETSNSHAMADMRRIFIELLARGIDVPVIISGAYSGADEDTIRIHAATDIGGLFIDGLGDGILLGIATDQDKQNALQWADICNKTAFGILQATRNRMSKTEYISCPSCGRTLFDLQETTAMIRKRTDHLKGIKIGIMGCIVNGPGEMADADYGYVGSGPGRITLYRSKDVVKKNVPSAQAVDELVNIIRDDGNWIDPEMIEKF
jgi:(E)-4-hydroxy-3-methylbut-2-enyl-diphosphate synthase